MTVFEVGKLPAQVLSPLLQKAKQGDTRVVVEPKIGEDAAVLDMGDRFLVVTTDPITFTQERLGWYAVNVNANDVATMGAKPRWFFATLLLPEGKSDQQLIETIFDDIVKSCQSLGVTLCGGHTEVTSGLDRPILVGQMLGEVSREKLVKSENVRVGDKVLLTHGIAIEGTAILACNKEKYLIEKLETKLVQKARRLLDEPGISVVRGALIACDVADIHAMHDLTEGGISTGLWELGLACNCGLSINGDAVPLFHETEAFCDILNLDPWGLIASGSLLIVLAPDEEKRVKKALCNIDIPCVCIGEVLPVEKGMKLYRSGQMTEIKPFHRDEITKCI